MRYSIIGATVQQVKSVGGSDIKEARSAGIIFVSLTEEQAARLKAQGCNVTKVGGVSAGVMPPVIIPPVPIAAAPVYSPGELLWATGWEDMRAIVQPLLYGEGLNCAVIGTGIRETHQRINGHVVYRKNYTKDPMRDGLDHDTGVCDIILTVAPLSNVLNLKVLNDKGEGTEEDVTLAIDDCISLHNTNPEIAPTVINLSLGSPDDGNPNNPLRVACRAAIDRNIWIFASAGNSGPIPYSITCPACERYVLAAGSIRYEPFGISDWSSRGPTVEGLTKPDAVQFGEDLVIASSKSDTATVAKSGTSFAVPFGSGLGMIFQEGMLRQAQIVERVVGFPPGAIPIITVKELIDTYLPMVCIKPENISLEKDNNFGYGLPYGPFAFKAMTVQPAMDIGAMLSPILTIALLAMVMGSIKKEG